MNTLRLLAAVATAVLAVLALVPSPLVQSVRLFQAIHHLLDDTRTHRRVSGARGALRNLGTNHLP